MMNLQGGLLRRDIMLPGMITWGMGNLFYQRRIMDTFRRNEAMNV